MTGLPPGTKRVGEGDAISSIDSGYIPGDGGSYDHPFDGLPHKAQDTSGQNSIARCDNRAYTVDRFTDGRSVAADAPADANGNAEAGDNAEANEDTDTAVYGSSGGRPVRPVVTDASTNRISQPHAATTTDRLHDAGRYWLDSVLL
jgi:hypothetical protein